MTITTRTNGDNPLGELRALVAFSKRHPDKFDWKKNLTDWHVVFVDHIVRVADQVPDMELSPKQRKKAIECIERMTLV